MKLALKEDEEGYIEIRLVGGADKFSIGTNISFVQL